MVQAGISSQAAGKLINKKLFIGNELQSKEFGDESGLETMDFNARMYDGQIGRFWQTDPLTDFFADLSGYAYSADNPISLENPSGLVLVGTVNGFNAPANTPAALLPDAAPGVTVSAKSKHKIQMVDVTPLNNTSILNHTDVLVNRSMDVDKISNFKKQNEENRKNRLNAIELILENLNETTEASENLSELLAMDEEVGERLRTAGWVLTGVNVAIELYKGHTSKAVDIALKKAAERIVDDMVEEVGLSEVYAAYQVLPAIFTSNYTRGTALVNAIEDRDHYINLAHSITKKVNGNDVLDTDDGYYQKYIKSANQDTDIINGIMQSMLADIKEELEDEKESLEKKAP